MKHRVTLTLDSELLAAVERAPGDSRSAKIERLIEEALAARARKTWERELEAFYQSKRAGDEREEDRDWQATADEAFGRDD